MEAIKRLQGKVAASHPFIYPSIHSFIHKYVHPCIHPSISVTLCTCWTALSTTHGIILHRITAHHITSPLCYISSPHTYLCSKHSKPVVCDYSPPCLGLEHFLIFNLPHYIQHKWYRTVARSPHTETVRKSLSVRKGDQFTTDLKELKMREKIKCMYVQRTVKELEHAFLSQLYK